jgi:hypothetical protein
MGMSPRHYHLQFAGLMFGVEGKLAMAEHYASLVDPRLFTWDNAFKHIGYRLQLSQAGLTSLALAITSERSRRSSGTIELRI